MSADVQHPLLIDIKDILKQRVDFSSPSKSEFKDVIPDNYNVLIPDRYRRGGSSSYGSPSTSNGDQLNSRRNSVSESECSTASSSPLSITKELTSVSSPLTPRSDVSRSKSKSQSPSRSGLTCSFLSEKSKSPTPIPGLGLMELDQIPLPSDEPELNAPPACESKTKSEREKEAPIENGTAEVPTRRENKKKKKKSKKRKRSRSPASLVSTTETQHHNSPERESSPSLCSSNSTSTEATQSSRDNDTNGTVKRVAESSISCLVNGDVGSRVPPIRLKISSKEEKKPLATATNLSAIFQQTPMQPKTLTIKVGATVMSRPLVAYSGSDEESEEEEDTPDTTETTVKAEPSTIVNGISSTKKEEKEKKRIVPIPVSPRTIIGPLKPSRETDKNVETMKAPIGPVKPSSSTNGEVAAPTREKRKNGSLQDATSSKRKRLLSERGETEAAYPVMDRTTISSWNWKECAAVRSRARGVGLHNSSNDCFLNAILQLITHTAPLARYIYESHQKERCSRPPGQCLCCAMCNSHLKRVFSGQGGAFMASWIRPYLRRIFPSHMHGMQEDAHELLSLMLDAFDPPPGHNKTTAHPNALVNAKPSTPIEQIFGGTLRNQVTCTGCDTPYTNYERIRELNLAIRKRADGDSIRISNLMDNYFRDENLTSFDCKKCGRKTTATRRTRVLRPPAVLLVQLKRFNAFGGKIRLPVSADMEVDLLRFLYDGSSPISSSQYVLTSVVEHLGAGVDHGHYVAYSRGFQGSQWYLFDDEQVQAVPAAKVVGSNPYLLVYSRRSDMGISSKSSSEVVQKPMGIGFNSTKQQNGFGPNQKKNHLHSNGGGSDMNRSFNNGRFNNNGNSKWNNGKPRHSFPQSSQKKWMPNLI